MTVFVNIICYVMCGTYFYSVAHVESYQYSYPFNDALQWVHETELASETRKSEQDSIQYFKRSLPDGASVDDDASWTGRWFPEKLSPAAPVQSSPTKEASFQRMWKMINDTCDNGKLNLTVDWSGSPINYTCYGRAGTLMPDPMRPSLIEKYNIPHEYQAQHVCMSSEINYTTHLPTFGPHRPAWARYGQYKFLPRQRWIHNLEHGAVVMLYHPCAHPAVVEKLMELVRACLYRHVITPYTLLPLDRPLALLTWGWSMKMADFDAGNAVEFIRHHALRGPEQTSHDGFYDTLLTVAARIVTSVEDSTLCPRRPPTG